MNNEKSEAQEEHAERGSVTDWERMVPSLYTLLPGELRESGKERVDQGNVTDCQTATYWG